MGEDHLWERRARGGGISLGEGCLQERDPAHRPTSDASLWYCLGHVVIEIQQAHVGGTRFQGREVTKKGHAGQNQEEVAGCGSRRPQVGKGARKHPPVVWVPPTCPSLLPFGLGNITFFLEWLSLALR